MRKSEEELAMEDRGELARLDRRAEPPEFLDTVESAIWRRIVEDKPAEWFSADTLVLLITYCRAAAKDHWYNAKIREGQRAIEDAGDDTDIDALDRQKAILLMMDKYVKWQDMNAKQLMAVATKLRLTNQAKIGAVDAGTDSRNTALGAKPWDDLAEEEAEKYIGELGVAGSC